MTMEFGCSAFDSDEVIRFTTASEIILTGMDRILMAVSHGTSASWGEFGGTYSWRLNWPTPTDNLISFNPAHSIANSQVTWGDHHVGVSQQTAFRHSSSDRLHHTDTADTIVEQGSVESPFALRKSASTCHPQALLAIKLCDHEGTSS